MAQLVARLVRNEKVGGSNPPSSTTGRHPIRMSVFCMPGRVGVVPVVVLLVAPLVFRALRCDALWGPAAVCAGGRRPARGHGAGLLVAPRVFRAPEGPAAREARRPHFVRRRASKPARALRTLRRPPHLWGRVAVRQLYASARCPARPCHCPLAPQPGPAGLASGPRAHRCWAYTECRMQFPRDLFEP